MDALDIEILLGDVEEPEHLEFTWDLIHYERQEIDIQLYFNFPQEISEDGTTDTVRVTFWGTEFFESEDGE